MGICRQGADDRARADDSFIAASCHTKQRGGMEVITRALSGESFGGHISLDSMGS